MIKKKNLKKGNKWDNTINKRLADIRKQAIENGNHFIFVLTSKETNKGTAVTGICNSSNFNVLRAADMFTDSVPVDIMHRVMIGKTLDNIGELLSKKVTKK